jgi:hypothetical protein
MPQLASKLLNYSHRNPVRVGRSLTGILLGAAAVLLGFFLLSLLLVTSARAHSIFLPRLAKSRIVNRSMDSPSAANIANSTSRVLPMAAISQVPKSSRPFFLGSHTVVGGFDSHSLPPFIFSHVGLSAPQRITLRSWLKVVVVINS